MAESPSLRFNFQAFFTHEVANEFLIGIMKGSGESNTLDDVVDEKEFCTNGRWD